MKRTLLVFLLVLTLVLVPGCKKKGPPVAGKAGAVDMLRLVPENPMMVMSFDMHAFASLPMFDKLMDLDPNAQKNAPFGDYKDFAKKSGIDLKRDIYYATMGIYGDLQTSKEADVGGAVNLVYSKETVLKLLAENNISLLQETYQGVVIYGIKTMEDGSGKEFRFAFLDNSNIAVGTPAKIKAVVDVFQGKAKSAYDDAKLRKVLRKTDTKSLFWLAIGSIPDSLKNQSSSAQIPFDVKKIEGFVGCLDYKSKEVRGEFKLLCSDSKVNQQLAALINGVKGMAAGPGDTPEAKDIANLVNSITVSAAGDSIRLNFTIGDDLLQRLMEKAKQKAESIAAPTPGPDSSPIPPTRP